MSATESSEVQQEKVTKSKEVGGEEGTKATSNTASNSNNMSVL